MIRYELTLNSVSFDPVDGRVARVAIEYRMGTEMELQTASGLSEEPQTPGDVHEPAARFIAGRYGDPNRER
jgi:hypothetical protein